MTSENSPFNPTISHPLRNQTNRGMVMICHAAFKNALKPVFKSVLISQRQSRAS